MITRPTKGATAQLLPDDESAAIARHIREYQTPRAALTASPTLYNAAHHDLSTGGCQPGIPRRQRETIPATRE